MPVKFAAGPARTITISQTALLGGALLIGFVVFLMLNGRLATYWKLLTGQAAPAGSPASQTATQGAATAVPVTYVTSGQSTGTNILGATMNVAELATLLG